MTRGSKILVDGRDLGEILWNPAVEPVTVIEHPAGTALRSEDLAEHRRHCADRAALQPGYLLYGTGHTSLWIEAGRVEAISAEEWRRRQSWRVIERQQDERRLGE